MIKQRKVIIKGVYIIKKRIINIEDVENLYLQEEMSVKKVAKIFCTNDRKITEILNNSSKFNVLYKLRHPNLGKKIKKPFRNKDKICEVCCSSKGVCFNQQVKKYLCQRHRCQVSKFGQIIKTYVDKNDYILHDNYAEIIFSDADNKNVYTTKISLDKLELVKQYYWKLHNHGYCVSKNNGDNLLMHRIIINAKENEQVDHINRDKLDNRNENLRIVCNSENQVNKKMMKNNTSGVTGVTWDKDRDKWKVSLNIYDKCYNLGRFDDFNEAVETRQRAEKNYHKEFMPIERQNKNFT